MSKVSIIGVGNLGAGIAQEISSRGIVSEIVLVDIREELARGQAADIAQGLPFRNNTKVLCGGYPKISGSDVVVITAGKPRSPDMKDRLMLAEINLKIIKQIVEEIKRYCPDTIIVTITNPMDLINKFIFKQGFDRMKVIGSGGQLDSSRLRVILGFPQKKVEAFVLGEHGQDQIPIFSRVLVDGAKVNFSDDEKKDLRERSKESALLVIEKKGATVVAPAINTANMVEAIMKNSNEVMICSMNLNGEYGLDDVSLGVPVLLGENGIKEILEWDLNEEELSNLKKSADKLKGYYNSLT